MYTVDAPGTASASCGRYKGLARSFLPANNSTLVYDINISPTIAAIVDKWLRPV